MKLRLPRSVTACLMRHRFRRQLRDLPFGRFRVRIAHTIEEHEEAFRLVRVAYAYQGILPVRGPEMRMTPQHLLPEATVLVAYEGEHPVATMTVTLDSPAGLPLDHDYPDAIRALRQNGARIVEYGSLAVVRRSWHTGVTVLLNMAAHWFSVNVLQATHCVIGLNPRIAPYYRAAYAFKGLGEPQGHAELITAPVEGLVQSFDDAARHFARNYRRPMRTGALPIEHFTEILPECIEMPPFQTLEELVRYKLPREVFRDLFVERTDLLQDLDPQTREHLASWRSIRTTAHVAGKSKPHPHIAKRAG